MKLHTPEHIKRLIPYRAGKPISELARERGLKRIVKLASNENPLGSSPRALEAVRQSLQESHRYVDPSSYDLTSKLAEYHNKERSQIICGAGVDSLLGNIILACSEAGDEVLTAHGTFIGIFVNTNKLNRKLVTVPLKNYKFDLAGILESVTAKTRIIYLASPNNPTGEIIPHDELDSFLSEVPQDVLVILDEAYFSYANEFTEYPDGMLIDRENVIVTRTFSKDYGLAGLRVGYAVGNPNVIREIYKVRLPFEPSYTGQVAAIAALDDTDFLEKVIKQNRKSLKQLRSALSSLGILFVDSYANFLLMTFEHSQTAKQFSDACLERGLILRQTDSFGVPEGVRINSGTDDETRFAIEVMRDVGSTVLTPVVKAGGVR